MYMSMKIKSKGHTPLFSSTKRKAASPDAASRIFHDGATRLTVRLNKRRKMASSSTNKRERFSGSSVGSKWQFESPNRTIARCGCASSEVAECGCCCCCCCCASSLSFSSCASGSSGAALRLITKRVPGRPGKPQSYVSSR